MIECPKCGRIHADATEDQEVKCEKCGFRFFVEVEYVAEFIVTCVDHEFTQTTRVLSSGKTYRVCRLCFAAEVVSD